jgi:acetyl esterase/lipase
MEPEPELEPKAGGWMPDLSRGVSSFVAFAAVLAFLGCASGPPTPVPGGGGEPLSSDEGYLVIHVDTDVAIERIAAGGQDFVRNLQPGRHLWLVRAKAGRARWTSVKLTPQPSNSGPIRPKAFSVLNEKEFEFEVEAGAVNYPGDLVIRLADPDAGIMAGISVRNRNHSAMAVRKLAKTHSGLLAAHPIRYAGSSGDEFLQFYTKERDRLAKNARSRPAKNGADAKEGDGVARLGRSAEAIVPGNGVTEVTVSPSGDWVAATVQRGREAMVVVQRVGLAKLATAVQSKWIGTIAWDATDTLIVEVIPPAGVSHYVAIGLSVVGGEVKLLRRPIRAPGRLVDSLPMDPEEVLWGLGGIGWTSLHRISIEELLDFNELYRMSGKTYDIAVKVAVVNGPSRRWVIARDGTPRAVLRDGEDATFMMMPGRLGGVFETVYRFADDEQHEAVIPVGLTADESRVLVLAYGQNDTRGLHEWDEKARAIGKPVFVHPDYDVIDVLRDSLTGESVAVVYEENGVARFHYFDEYRDRFLSRLEGKWQTDSIAIVSGSADRQVFVIREASATNPGDFHLRDRAGGVYRIGRFGENVDRAGLSPAESFRVKSRDGVEVEAYLTRPRSGEGRAPLVVMPHGGPADVRDRRQFDPMVQYLASWGFAVLQVNYRGSSGYGLEFQKLGRKQWGRGIEDDIDAAVDQVRSRSDVDAENLCVAGWSYGGFSALASVVRHRDRYRCAISINGVADVPLFSDSSDTGDWKLVGSFFKEYIGDLETERAKLIEISPAYHAEEIETPTQIVFGTDDRRVDPDHAHRMALMLGLHGKSHETLEIEDMDHGGDRDDLVVILRAMRRFLTTHLMPDGAFVPDPRS